MNRPTRSDDGRADWLRNTIKKKVIKIARKTTTRTEVKNRWNAKTYKRYQVSLRKEEDADLIQYVESLKGRIGTSDIFRIGIETIKKEGL